MKRPYDVQSIANDNVKLLLDALIEVNAYKFHAEQDGWDVKFVVQNGGVDVNISRNVWPTFEGDE